ncbi:ABC transporter permease subunit [Spirillospora sp. CA-253888]
MMWLSWRQFRVPAAAVFAALALLAAVLGLTGPGLADDYAAGSANCAAGGGCERFAEDFFEDHQVWFLASLAIMLLLPALIGLFWGAPMIARELEAGTHRLVWNQGVTRTRWLAVKLAMAGLAAVAAAGLGSLMTTWWAEPIDASAAGEFARLDPLLFGVRGVVPVGYALFAFAFGVTAGMLVRRAMPAMALTLAVFAAVQIAMPLLVRPHLLPAVRETVPLAMQNLDLLGREPGPGGKLEVEMRAPQAGAWDLSNTIVDASGRAVEDLGPAPTSGPCSMSQGKRDVDARTCLADLTGRGYRQRVVYHEAGRYWTFQWLETGIYTALALGLSGLCLWWLRRRVS